jgi:hypothetical protein
MKYLFPLLKTGGFYIIEDLGRQPSRYDSSLPSSEKTVWRFWHRFCLSPAPSLFNSARCMRPLLVSGFTSLKRIASFGW